MSPVVPGVFRSSDAGGDGPRSDHLDLTLIFKKLPELEEVHITYGYVVDVLFDEVYSDLLLFSSVKNCGMNFDWSLFKFTQRDCSLLAKVLENFMQSGRWTHRSMFMKIQD